MDNISEKPKGSSAAVYVIAEQASKRERASEIRAETEQKRFGQAGDLD